MKKHEIFVALHVLKQGRSEMVQEFLDHKPEIYGPSFKYENSPVLLSLAREKYFTTWLTNHWQRFNRESVFFQSNLDSETTYAKIFLKLIEKWGIVKSDDVSQLNLGINLISEMQETLSEFIRIGNNSDLIRNKLEVDIERNRVLFDREIKKLSKEQ